MKSVRNHPLLFASLVVVVGLGPIGCRLLGLEAPACVSTEDCPFDMVCTANSICVDPSGDGGRPLADAGRNDAGANDAGAIDAGNHDAGNRDAGLQDAGGGDDDAGHLDAGPSDAGPNDAGPSDGGSDTDGDVGAPDAGQNDAGQTDAGQTDAGQTDAGQIDAGQIDAGQTDAGVPNVAPLAEWSFETGFDSDDGAYPGTISGSVYRAPGAAGQGAYFHGDNTSVVVAGIGDLLRLHEQVSMMAWIRDDGTATYKAVATVGDPDSYPDVGLGHHGGRFLMEVGRVADTYALAADYDSIVAGGTWHHYAVVFDGAQPDLDGRARIYLDGILQPIVPGKSSMPARLGELAGMPLEISAASYLHWEGFIDEFKIYRRAVTGQEVADAFSAVDLNRPQDYRMFMPFEAGLRDITDRNDQTIDLEGLPTYVDNGAVGKAVRLQGAARLISYRPQSWMTNAPKFSVATWFKANVGSQGTNRELFGVRVDQSHLLLHLRSSGSLLFEMAAAGNVVATAVVEDFDRDYPPETWHHIVAVFDGTNPSSDRIKFFVDGVPVTTNINGAPPTTLGLMGEENVNLGSNTTTLAGALDEFMLFDRALTATEAAQLFAISP